MKEQTTPIAMLPMAQLIAEGVETTEQESILTGLGVDMLQGFLFSEPLSAEAVAPFVEGRNV